MKIMYEKTRTFWLNKTSECISEYQNSLSTNIKITNYFPSQNISSYLDLAKTLSDQVFYSQRNFIAMLRQA